MTLELRDTGVLVLEEVSNEAWDYINRERAKLKSDFGWYFSRERFNGKVYVHVTEYEDKAEAYRLLCALREQFGMELGPSAQYLIEAWRDAVEAHNGIAAMHKAERATEKHIEVLKNLIRYGCRGCPRLTVIQSGDDYHGYCQLDGKKLDTAYADYERFGGFNGGCTWRQMFLPGKACKFLDQKKEKDE